MRNIALPLLGACLGAALALYTVQVMPLRPEDKVPPTAEHLYFEQVSHLRSDCWGIAANSDVFDNEDPVYLECLKVLKVTEGRTGEGSAWILAEPSSGGE